MHNLINNDISWPTSSRDFKTFKFIDPGMDLDYVVLQNPETKVKILHLS